MSVYDIALVDPTDRVRPPERVLRVSSVGELAFVSIEKFDEGNPKSTQEVIETITVSLPGLREALDLLARDGQREDLREKDARGEYGANIKGDRMTVVPL